MNIRLLCSNLLHHDYQGCFASFTDELAGGAGGRKTGTLHGVEYPKRPEDWPNL